MRTHAALLFPIRADWAALLTQCFWPSVSSSTPSPTLRPHRWRPRRVSLPLLPPLQLSSKHRLLRLSPSAPSPAAASTCASRPRSAALVCLAPPDTVSNVHFFYLCSWCFGLGLLLLVYYFRELEQ